MHFTSTQAIASLNNEGNDSQGNQNTGKTITGTVKDISGEPLVGVTIQIEGTTQGVITV